MHTGPLEFEFNFTQVKIWGKHNLAITMKEFTEKSQDNLEQRENFKQQVKWSGMRTYEQISTAQGAGMIITA